MDLGFGAHDTLSQRGWNGEESVRNLLGRQTAYLPQHQCYASFRRQRWMTAGEDQPKPVVLDALVFKGRSLAGLDSELLRDSRLRRVEPGPPSHRVDGPEPARRNEPRAGIGGHALLWPSLEGSPLWRRCFNCAWCRGRPCATSFWYALDCRNNDRIFDRCGGHAFL